MKILIIIIISFYYNNNNSDPLFQKALVETVRESPTLFHRDNDDIVTSSLIDKSAWSGLPVIFDEVFTGLYRLGAKSCAADLLQTEPDILINAKLLTGGLLPLAVTLASDSIFKSFLSPSKLDGLLHGHSYTAHPVGCSVAVESLNTLQRLDIESSPFVSTTTTDQQEDVEKVKPSEWTIAKQNWAQEYYNISNNNNTTENTQKCWSFWSKQFVENISSSPQVEESFAMGCVLVLKLRDEEGVSGYSSNAVDKFKMYLKSRHQNGLLLSTDDNAKNNNNGSETESSQSLLPFDIHIRGLGNVLYFMTGLKPDLRTIKSLEDLLLDCFSK